MADKFFPIVALVGPPNAGKSALMNKILGQRLAITSQTPGTTRDRQYAGVKWAGQSFQLVDTAGLNLTGKGELETSVQKQIEIALNEAGVIILVVDGKLPLSAIDRNGLLKFRRIKKPKILAVNKIDSPKDREEKIARFARLGIKPLFMVSALTGAGVGDLLDKLAGIIKTQSESLPPAERRGPSAISVAIVGRQNTGKSSLFNKILNQHRAVVSALPGTTRASIDEGLIINNSSYTFIDTAGLKKKAHRQAEPDIYGGFQTFKSIRKSDVCLLVIDAAEAITSQDQKIAREIMERQKGCVIVVNKIDASTGAGQALKNSVSRHFPFLWMCPVFFVSAITGEGINDALNAIKPIYDRRNKRIDGQILLEFLRKIFKKNPPRRLRDQKKPKVFSLDQTDINPPTFELAVNHPAAISSQFRRFLENSIIKELDFWGTPIKLRLIRKN